VNKLFIDNKYTRWYFSLIENAKSHRYDGYTEKHHILPRKMFPESEKDPDNIVVLSAREHFIAHLLLTKMCARKEHTRSMLLALKMLASDTKNGRRYTSRIFDVLRPKVYAAISDGRKGMKFTPEHRANMSLALKGRTSPNKGKKFSEEHKRRLSEVRKGREPWNKGKVGVYSQSTRDKITEGLLKYHREK
jgi:NUMOD3 motif-containing protein